MFTNKSNLFNFKRTLKLRTLLVLKLNYLIKAEFLTTHDLGSDEEFERIAFIAAQKLLRPEIFNANDDSPVGDYPADLKETLLTEYSEKKSDVDSIIEEISCKKQVMQTMCDYWQIQNFLESQMSKQDKDKVQYYLSQIESLGFTPTVLAFKDLRPMRRVVKKDIKDLKEAISDHEALKINISTTGIVVLVSVASPLFLITGYLYNSFLFSSFGIDVSKFFTLLDYIAASASKLGYTLFSAGLGTLSYFLGAHSYSRKPIAEKMRLRDKPMYSHYLITAGFFILSVVGYFSDIRMFYNNALFTIICLSLLLLPRICLKYFEKPLPILFVFVFVICFFANLWASLGKTINELKYGEFATMKTYDIKLEDSLSSIPTSNFVLITGNSSFFFFLDQNRKIHIINKDQVESLKQKKEAGSKRSFLFPRTHDS